MTNDTLNKLRLVIGANAYYQLVEERARAINPEAWEEAFDQAEQELLEEAMQELLVEQARAHCESCFSH